MFCCLVMILPRQPSLCLNDNRAEANELRLAFKKVAKEKQLTYCLTFNAKGVPCADGRCRYYPCCEWSELYEIEVTAGGLKGSFCEGMPDSMKPKIKEKRPLDNRTRARRASATARSARWVQLRRLDQPWARRMLARTPFPMRQSYETQGRVRNPGQPLALRGLSMENAGPSADPFLSSDRYARDGQRGLSKLKDTQRLVHTVPSNRLAQAPSPFGMPWARLVWTPAALALYAGR